MAFYPYHFTAPIEAYDFGRMAYTVVYLPDDLIDVLPLDEYPKLRIEGDAAGIPFKGALMPVRGRWYLMFNRKSMKQSGTALGDQIDVQFAIADQDEIDIPVELAETLAEDAEAKAIWDDWTVGKRRGWAHRISSAKTPPTRYKRISELLDVLFNS